MRDRIYKGQAQGAPGRSVDAPFQRLDKKRPRGEWPEWRRVRTRERNHRQIQEMLKSRRAWIREMWEGDFWEGKGKKLAILIGILSNFWSSNDTKWGVESWHSWDGRRKTNTQMVRVGGKKTRNKRVSLLRDHIDRLKFLRAWNCSGWTVMGK